MPAETSSDLVESLRFIQTIFGPLAADAGVATEDVAAAEERLGVRLPHGLRMLYERTGCLRSLHAAHNTLVALDELDFAGDHLIFYEENQGVVAWGIARPRLSEPNPPVDQGQPPRADGGPWVFFPEFTSISEFLRCQAAWQAVQGGLPFVGVKEGFSDGVRAITEAFGVPPLQSASMRAWPLKNGVIVETGDGYVGLGTQEADTFLTVTAKIGIAIDDWDYATLRDEVD